MGSLVAQTYGAGRLFGAGAPRGPAVQSDVGRRLRVFWTGAEGQAMSGPKLTRTPRGLRRVRTGYAYEPPALGTYRRRRAACPQGPTYCTYGVHVPASGVGYVPRTVAPQVRDDNLQMSDMRTEHEALPPLEGRKYSANLWLHQYDFRGPNTHGCDLGQRVKRPEWALSSYVPSEEEGQEGLDDDGEAKIEL